jgi:hypothetical protein
MPYPQSGAFGKVEEPIINDPAAGSELIITFDSANFIVNRVYELMWLRFQFVTSAVVAVRSVAIEYRYGGQLSFVTTTVVTQAAALTYQYIFYPGITPSAALEVGNRVKLAAPPSMFIVDQTNQPQIRTTTVNRQAADQFSIVAAQFRVSQQ